MNAPLFLSRPALVSCAGEDIESLVSAVRERSRRGLVPVRAFNGAAFLAGIVGEAALPPARAGEGKLIRMTGAALGRLDGDIEYAARRYGADRVAVCAGSCDNGSEASFAAHRAFFQTGRFPAAYALDAQNAALPARFIARSRGLRGPRVTCAAACASGAEALFQARCLIRSGICDAAVAGGVDLASDTALLGFDALGALSDEPSNPFSKNRRGINLGDAACFFVVSRDPPPSSEPPLALLGCGRSADAFHMTAPLEDGAGAARAMAAALRDAGLRPRDIGYINLHGTGTAQNDRAEARAVRSVFGADCPPSGSTKGVTGHTLGAAGALEAALCREAARTGTALPHVWDGVYDDDMPRLRFAGTDGGEPRARFCMSNSFAFGGSDISLIIGGIDI